MRRVRRFLARLRRRPPNCDSWAADGPDDEPALVPRRPRPSPSAGAVVLDFPPPPDDVDARGREAS